MSISRIFAGTVMVLVLNTTTSVALAADNVFSGKSQEQHELTDAEKKKMDAEFASQFKGAEAGAFQQLNNNPWASKKAREDQHAAKMMELSDSWGSCREYAYKQRGQCYARGGDAYTCERYYDARVSLCDEKF